MARPRLLDTNQELILTIRVYIARTTSVISRQEIADGFGIDMSTLHRYVSDTYREYSRLISQEQWKHRPAPTNQCAYCQAPIGKHTRCKDCAVLLHAIPTWKNGGSRGMKLCYSCEEARERITYGSSMETE